MSSRFSRSLPPRPDLAQQKKQAKDLLRAFDSGDAEAIARVRSELPDKKSIALADAQLVLAREYGFATWSALTQHIEARVAKTRSPQERMADALDKRDAAEVRRLFEQHPEFRARINDTVFPFDSTALLSFSDDPAMVDVLLEFGADPNRRSDWWAGGFHVLHHATGAVADRLIAAGAIPDACGAANLDRPDLLARMIAENPARIHERGGDGQTPLHFARSRAVVDLLLAKGADIDARDIDHRSTPAEWMLDRKRGAGRYDLAMYLVERGASTDLFLAAALGLTGRVREMLRENRSLLDRRTARGEYDQKPPASYHIHFWTIGHGLSPMAVAEQFEHPETLAAMLEVASPRQRFLYACRKGDAAMAKAVLRDTPAVVRSLTPEDHRAITDAAWSGDAKAVALMLVCGFDPRTPGHDSGTALHCAAWEGSAETVAALLHRDLSPLAIDPLELVAITDAHYGATPLGWCCHGSLHGNTAHDHAGVARLLLEAGATRGPDATDASESVEAVLEAWNRLQGTPK